MERGLHQKIQVEHTGERTRYEVAIYRDRIANTVVNGGGDLSAADLNSGYVVYDPVTELLNVAGASYTTKGVVGDLKTRIHGETWLTLGFADGDALTMPAFAVPASLEGGLTTLKPQAHADVFGGHERPASARQGPTGGPPTAGSRRTPSPPSPPTMLPLQTPT